MKRPLLSILVPMFNEQAIVDRFFGALNESLDTSVVDLEFVCVDDGSSDKTLECLLKAAEADPRIKIVAFSRNFGKEAAMTAALDYASGDCVIPIDADLQDPPELINEMVTAWAAGNDVVYAKRTHRETDTAIKRITAGLFYRVFNMVSETAIPENVGDYRLMSRRVVDVIKALPERERFMKGLYAWPGFESETIEFSRKARLDGHSKFNYWKLWNFALSGITSFSTVPIRISTYMGLVIAVLAFLYGAYVAGKTIVWGIDVPGYASLIVIILFLGGVQLVVMGLTGEYIGRIYKEVKGRPLYVVKKTVGFGESKTASAAAPGRSSEFSLH